jgi:hypothetical protein
MPAPVVHILPLTTIQRQRLLPVSGRVTVRKGQKVEPADVIAEANLTPEHLVLDVARGLGVSPGKADQHVQRKAGEHVGEGDIIAGPVGIARRVVRAPRPGQIIVVGNGQVLLELESTPYRLLAGIPGEVISLIPERGAVIENTGALVQAVWGNGRIDFGLLHVLASQPEQALTADQLDVSLRGSIVLAGYCEQAEAFKAGAEAPIRGLILASMPANLVPVAERMPYPIAVIEGFGLLPMNEVAFTLLSTSDRREIAINAQTWDRFEDRRPEVFLPLPSEGRLYPPQETVDFSANQKVRVVRAPYKSEIGTIVAVHSGLEVFPSGVQGPAAEVHLENGQNMILPLANLEVLV